MEYDFFHYSNFRQATNQILENMIAIVFLIFPQFKKLMEKERKIRYNLEIFSFVKFHILLYQQLDFMYVLGHIKKYRFS